MTSSRVPRPYLPLAWHRPTFDTLHSLSHPSIRATRRIASSKFVWPGLAKDVTQWARTCIRCQVVKVQRHTRAPRQQFELPDRCFQHIHVDIVGPLPKSEGQTYLFTILDRFTRWPEAVTMADSTVESCAQVLLHNWIARFGIPDTVTSDRGAQFTGQLWHQFAQRFGFQCNHTTAYHPQANGLIERLHRHLKASLTARLTTSTWTQELPWVLLGLRTAFKEDIGSSSAELVYGTTFSFPGELIVPNTSPDPPHSSFLRQLRNVANSFRPTPTSANSKHGTYMPTGLQQARFVFVCRDAHKPPLQPPYDGPFPVVSRHTKHFLLDIGGRQDKVSIDRLKPALLDHGTETTVATRPKRGRSPKSSIGGGGALWRFHKN